MMGVAHDGITQSVGSAQIDRLGMSNGGWHTGRCNVLTERWKLVRTLRSAVVFNLPGEVGD